MKTTVDIPDELYGQARKLAAARGQQLATLIAEGLQKLVVSKSARPPAKAGKNGAARGTDLPKATLWLVEWRALSQQQTGKGMPIGSAAETVSRMRR